MREMELEIFRAGHYGPKGDWDEDALEGLARDYDASIHEAPVTLDHAQSGPALGWVASVRRVGDRLVARLRDLNPAFTELLKEGAFKKRSVELYPEAAHSGRPYLKAVSFLGAATPAVKGLRDILLNDEGDAIHFEQTLQDALHIDFVESEEARPERDNATRAPESPKSSATSYETAASDETEHKVEPKDEAERGNELDFTEFRDGLVACGAWLPSWEVQGIEDFVRELGRLGPEEFQAGGSASLLGWFGDFLTGLPRFLPLGESAGTSKRQIVSERFAEGLIDDADNIDPESLERHRKVSLLMDTQPGLCYADALRLSSKS